MKGYVCNKLPISRLSLVILVAVESMALDVLQLEVLCAFITARIDCHCDVIAVPFPAAFVYHQKLQTAKNILKK